MEEPIEPNDEVQHSEQKDSVAHSLIELEPSQVLQTDNKKHSNRDIFENSEQDTLDVRGQKQEEQADEKSPQMLHEKSGMNTACNGSHQNILSPNESEHDQEARVIFKNKNPEIYESGNLQSHRRSQTTLSGS